MPGAVPAGQLSRRSWRTVEDLADHTEGHGEHIVKYERHSLLWGHRTEDNHERRPHRVGQHRRLRRVVAYDPVFEFGHVGGHEVLPA